MKRVISFLTIILISVIPAITLAQVGFFYEDFEDGSEWQQFTASGSDTTLDNTNSDGADHTSGSGYFALFYGKAPGTTKNDPTLTSDDINLSDAVGATLIFYYLEFELETDESFTLNFWNGSSWDEISVFDGSKNSVSVGGQSQSDWQLKTVTISSTYWVSDFKIQFVGKIGSAKSSDAVGIDDIQIDKTIPVELSSFSANAREKWIELAWSTATETENLGFHIYRSMVEEGEYTQITQELIPGAGNSAEAHTYSYTDYAVEAGKTYYYKLADLDFNGNLEFHGPVSVTLEALPTEYALMQNYPNPFNPETSIRFSLKESGEVALRIYNLQGQMVRTLVSGYREAGNYYVMWNGTDTACRRVASGIYIYKLEVNGFSDSKRMVFMK